MTTYQGLYRSLSHLKCKAQLTKTSFPSVPGSYEPPNDWKKAGKQALEESKSFSCPHCGVELRELIRIGIYRDEIATDFSLISCLDDKLRLVLCPKCKRVVRATWLGWLRYLYTKKPSDVYPNPRFTFNFINDIRQNGTT